VSDYTLPLDLTQRERDLLTTQFQPGETRSVMALHETNGRGGSQLHSAVYLLLGREVLSETRGMHGELRGYRLTPTGCALWGWLMAGKDGGSNGEAQ
jgi:hypothetical protein